MTGASEEDKWKPRMWQGRGIDWIMPGPSRLGKELRFYARNIYSKKYISAFTFGYNVNYL